MKNNIPILAMKWLPSIVMVMIFVENGLGKVINSDTTDKVIKSEAFIMAVGVLLIVASVLFLFKKTMIWGASFMVLYMTVITGIHWYKDKPFEVVALIVVGVVFATFIRRPEAFMPVIKE